MMRFTLVLAATTLGYIASATAVTLPNPTGGTYVIAHFTFADGETLENLHLHYVTYGTPRRNADGQTTNAVLIIHGTGGSSAQFMQPKFAGVLFKPGGELDARYYYIILPDEIGHGASSKPSDGLRAKFPHYGYHDMVHATHALLADGLHVNHLRLVMGTSMGGMQTWMWGEMYPHFMDALMPLACLPVAISGRNRIWRDMIADAIVSDPAYHGGNYATEPAAGLKTAADLLWFVGSAPLYDQQLMPTGAAADAYYQRIVAVLGTRLDANDLLYQVQASRDYDPEPELGAIVAPLLAINSADDQINPPELRIVEREIGKVKRGRFVLLPITNATRGHGTHTLPAIWHDYLRQLLDVSDRARPNF
jgi:homoserine O-acetyltransferase/O-succinyltransferase